MAAEPGRGRAFDILTIGSAFVAAFFSLATVLPNFNEDLRGSGLTLLLPTTAGALGATLVVAGIRWNEYWQSKRDKSGISRYNGFSVAALGGLLVLGSLTWAVTVDGSKRSTVASQSSTARKAQQPATSSPLTREAALGGTTTTVTTVSALPFTDDFSTSTGWTKAPNSGSSFEVADGEYRMILRPGGYQGVYSAAPLGELRGSIRISVDARQVDGTDVAFGFFCRGGPGTPPRPVYTARIDRTGAWMIWRFDAQAPHLPRTLAAGVSPSVRSEGISHLALDCVGHDASEAPVSLRFSVNGRVLGEAHDQQGLGVGRIGLHLLSSRQTTQDTEIRFDNLTVTRI